MKRRIKEPKVEIDDGGLIIRAMTYNIHSCVDADRNVHPKKIANIIEDFDVDIAALQEVDVEKPIHKNRSQARIIASMLNMDYRFFPVENNGLRAFGLAVLSRFPFVECYCDWLPNLYPKLNPRKRGAIRATLQTPCGIIHIFNTHLSLYKLERKRQLKALLGESWLLSVSRNEPVIFCGDLNAGALSKTYRNLAKHLIDVQKASGDPMLPKPTFHSRSPVFRIDHIFVSEHFTPFKVEVKRNQETRMASDHLPLVVNMWMKSLKSDHLSTRSDIEL
jgi:endonuclease/exonuclease/phosphatase family metal-dependent hydrolase